MAKRPTIAVLTSSYLSQAPINSNFSAIAEAFDNTLSRDGSTPNQMQADIDLNNNDLLNVNELTATRLKVGNTVLVPGDISGFDGDFLDLNSTPSSFSGQGGKILAVNSGGTAIEFNDVLTNQILETDSVATVTGTFTFDNPTTFNDNVVAPSVSGDIIATQVEAEALTATNKIMAPASVKQALDETLVEQHIVTKNYSSGGVIEFTETDSSKYIGYKFLIYRLVSGGISELGMRFSSDGGTSFESGSGNYQSFSMSHTDNDGSGAPDYNEEITNFITFGNVSNPSTVVGEITIMCPHRIDTRTSLFGHLIGFYSANTRLVRFSGSRQGNIAHNAFQFRQDISGGTISMLGIKDFS